MGGVGGRSRRTSGGGSSAIVGCSRMISGGACTPGCRISSIVSR